MAISDLSNPEKMEFIEFKINGKHKQLNLISADHCVVRLVRGIRCLKMRYLT